MAAVWQQVLGLDARYNAYRAPNNPQFRTLYIRRRSQLLRETAKSEVDPSVRKEYLKLRSQFLSKRYGTQVSDQISVKSFRTPSLRSQNRNESAGSLEGRFKRHGNNSTKHPSNVEQFDGVVPTYAAEASKAMVGHKTIAENYAFAGMHHIFDQHSKAVMSVKFANDDKSRIACCSMDGTLSVCQLIPPPATIICTLKGHTSGVTDFVWSISNDIILSSSLDGTARLWKVASGECIRVVQDSCGAEVWSCTFQPLNNNMFVIGNSKCTVQMMNVSTGKLAKGGTGKTLGQVLCVCFDSGGQILWAGDDKGYMTSFMCDVGTGKLTKAKRTSICEGHPITCISSRSWISREARDPSLLVNCGVNSLCLFRVSSSDASLHLRKRFTIKQRSQIIHSTFCPLMSFRQGACVVSGSEDMTVYFFDIEREEKACVNKLQGHSAPVLDVCFNYDESLLASCDADGVVIIWKRENYK